VTGGRFFRSPSFSLENDMLYKTRNLIAQREIPLSDRLLKPGEAFSASHVDAEYYIGKGSAREVDDKSPAAPAAPAAKKVVTPAEPPAAEAQRKRTRAAVEAPRAVVSHHDLNQETENKKAPGEGDPTGSQQKPDAAG
jgi:hypothetical protein